MPDRAVSLHSSKRRQVPASQAVDRLDDPDSAKGPATPIGIMRAAIWY